MRLQLKNACSLKINMRVPSNSKGESASLVNVRGINSGIITYDGCCIASYVKSPASWLSVEIGKGPTLYYFKGGPTGSKGEVLF